MFMLRIWLIAFFDLSFKLCVFVAWDLRLCGSFPVAY